MTYLAAILLLYMDCYSAFVCLVNMLSKYHFLSFFRMDLREVWKEGCAISVQL